jgi:replicative DNA helicase
MNASELADELENTTRHRNDTVFIQAATMLRQQQYEIQALHQILGYEGIEVGRDYLDECVADLRKAQEK